MRCCAVKWRTISIRCMDATLSWVDAMHKNCFTQNGLSQNSIANNEQHFQPPVMVWSSKWGNDKNTAKKVVLFIGQKHFFCLQSTVFKLRKTSYLKNIRICTVMACSDHLNTTQCIMHHLTCLWSRPTLSGRNRVPMPPSNPHAPPHSHAPPRSPCPTPIFLAPPMYMLIFSAFQWPSCCKVKVGGSILWKPPPTHTRRWLYSLEPPPPPHTHSFTAPCSSSARPHPHALQYANSRPLQTHHTLCPRCSPQSFTWQLSTSGRGCSWATSPHSPWTPPPSRDWGNFFFDPSGPPCTF